MPTTWKPVPTVERFRKVISLAGFGGSHNHTASIGLTEAEAAAVYTARSMPGIFQVGYLHIQDAVSLTYGPLRKMRFFSYATLAEAPR